MTELPVIDDTQRKMIEEFQCPGCACGGPTICDAFKFDTEDGLFRCATHAPGTNAVTGAGLITVILGLPMGFNRFSIPKSIPDFKKMRLWKKGVHPEWNHFNVPVWAMEYEGYLLVRTYMPRIDLAMIDVIEGGTLDMAPGALDVSKFQEGMN